MTGGASGARGAARVALGALVAFLVLAAVLFLPAVAPGIAGVPGASAAAPSATGIEAVARALRTDPVYVDPAASGKLSAADARALTARIGDSGVPIYVAVLPDDPVYGGARVFDRLRAAVGRPGVYAVALGSRFGAASDASVLAGSTAKSLAARNVREHAGDPSAILDGFVADVARRPAVVAAGGTGEAVPTAARAAAGRSR